MHALIRFCINQYTKYEVLSFTNYKDIIGAKFKKISPVRD